MNKLKLVLILLGLTIYLLSDSPAQALTHSRKVQPINYLHFWCSIPVINNLPECKEQSSQETQQEQKDQAQPPAGQAEVPAEPPLERLPSLGPGFSPGFAGLRQIRDNVCAELNQPDHRAEHSKCVSLINLNCFNTLITATERKDKEAVNQLANNMNSCMLNSKLEAVKDSGDQGEQKNPKDPAYTSLGPELFEGLVGYLCDSTYWGEASSKACENHTLLRCVKNETRDDFEKCVRSKFSRTPHTTYAEMLAERGQTGTSGTGTHGAPGSTRTPVVPPPALVGKVSDEYISALGAWCDVQCEPDKKATCMDSVGFACEKNVEFKKCIESEAKKLCLAPAPPPAGAAPPARPPVIAPVITVQALINGLEKVDLFTGVGKVTFSAKITVNNNSSCVKMQTSFELRQAQKNELITLPISNTTSCEGYSIDLDELKLTPGEYELRVKPNNQSSAKATLTIKSASPTPTTPSVLACDVEVYETHPNFIKARVRILSDEGSAINYNRANWFVKEIPPNRNQDFEVTEMVFKGTNIQNKVVKRDGKLYLETTETVLGDLKSKTGYRIKAQVYSEQTGSVTAAGLRGHATCQGHSILTSDDKIRSFKKSMTNSVVLGDSNIPLESTSFDIVPSVSPNNIVAINVRIVTLDLNGREQETLFNNIWENGRPLGITVNNPSQVSAVKVTVSMVDETNQFSPSEHTSYIPVSSSSSEIDQTRQDVPQSFHLLTSPDLEVLEQSIRNGQSAITFIASSEYPVSDPSFSVNGERMAPHSILCADKKLGPCGYHLTLYAPFVGEYSVSFEDQVVRFSAPEAVSEVSQKDQSTKQEGGGGAVDLIKITISKEDGTDPQVIYENGQFNPTEFANLAEGDNRLIVTKQYSNGETKTDYLLVRRQAQTEPQQPAGEEPTKQPPVEQVAPPPQAEPVFSHRTCGDVSGNVIVDVYSDGSEVAGTNCEDLGQVCTLFDNNGRQDATCVDKQETG